MQVLFLCRQEIIVVLLYLLGWREMHVLFVLFCFFLKKKISFNNDVFLGRPHLSCLGVLSSPSESNDTTSLTGTTSQSTIIPVQ